MISAEQVQHLPEAPGVYLFKDAAGKVLYVGKAGNLRVRVRTHVSGQSHIVESEDMLQAAETVDYLVTDNEVEALLLEHSLIQRHKPRYNVRLKDDKRYPFIKVTIQEEFPRVYLTRQIVEDGSLYFGPYARVRSARQALSLITEIFPIRSCSWDSKELPKKKACVDFEIKHCVAPCEGYATPEEYQALCREVIRFLQGKHGDIRRMLEERMNECAERTAYEQAAVFRDRIRAIDEMLQKQKIIRPSAADRDFVGLGRYGDVEAAAVFHQREGSTVGGIHYFFEGGEKTPPEERIRSFILSLYSHDPLIPHEICVRHNPEDLETLEAWLSGQAGRKVILRLPQRGENARMLELAEKNATHRAEEQYRKLRGVKEKVEEGVPRLQEALALPDLPRRIEGYDISNLQGVFAVGAMVVFENGRPLKSGYRRFQIRQQGKPDDYAMMREMLRRRLAHKDDDKFGPLPDLFLIDGGLGHLNAALEAIDEPIPVISIAKREEVIYAEGQDEPLVLPITSPELRLLMAIRDEAHRFGLGYHVKLRDRSLRSSALDQIEGIGPRRKKALLLEFGSVNAIRVADLDDLARIPGITLSLAHRIKETLAELEAREEGEDSSGQ